MMLATHEEKTGRNDNGIMTQGNHHSGGLVDSYEIYGEKRDEDEDEGEEAEEEEEEDDDDGQYGGMLKYSYNNEQVKNTR